MPSPREHPLDRPLAAMTQALKDADAQMAQMAKGISDFDSKELTPAEDELVFHNPHLRYLGQTHPETGLPYTNAQAAQQLLAELGPEQYVQYVSDFVRRADRRAKEGNPDASTGSDQPSDVTSMADSALPVASGSNSGSPDGTLAAANGTEPQQIA